MRRTTPRTGFRFKLKDSALETMAGAIGPRAFLKNGQPNQAILLGTNRNGTATMLLAGKKAPSAGTIATVAMRHAKHAGIDDPWQAARELFEIVPVGDGVEA